MKYFYLLNNSFLKVTEILFQGLINALSFPGDIRDWGGRRGVNTR